MKEVDVQLGLPQNLPIISLPGVVLLPQGPMPLLAIEKSSQAAIKAALKAHRLIGVVQPIAALGAKKTKKPQLFGVGCLGRIVSFAEIDEDSLMIVVNGICRFDVQKVVNTKQGFLKAQVDYIAYQEDVFSSSKQILDRSRLIAALERFCHLQDNSINWEELAVTSDQKLLSILTMIGPFAPQEKQAILEIHDLESRAYIITSLMEIAALHPLANSEVCH